jgi:GntR family transcriptional repressor for pyruvate dehydrogenase complex
MFKPIKNTKLYEQVIAQIKEMIASGNLKKGDKLPSERELVEKLQVSRASIREALRALQLIGLIECRQGEGNFIRENFEDSLFEPLSTIFMLNKGTTNEILELRRIIEVESAALAAEKITDEEVGEIMNLVEALKNAENEEEKVKIDKQFHYKIAAASQNSLVVSILESVSSLMEAFIQEARGSILIIEENKNIIAQQHENICNALRQRDGKKAANAMRKHLALIEKHIIY